MHTVIIRKISSKSLSRILGTLYGLMGFVGGLFVLTTTLVSGPPEEVQGAAVHLFGIAAPVFFALIYGAFGFVFGFVGAWLYNLIAGKIGGVSIEVESPPLRE